MRVFGFLTLVVLAGCQSPDVGSSLQEDPSEYRQALIEGDAERAIALLEAHAGAGDLDAMKSLVDAYDRRHIQTPYDDSTMSSTNLPIRAYPWNFFFARRRFERALKAGVDAGNETALFLATHELFMEQFDKDSDTPTAVLQDSIRTMYRQLETMGADPFRLAMLASNLDDDEAYRAHLAAAAEAGNATACAFKAFVDHRGEHGAAALADQIDDLEVCRELTVAADTDRRSLAHNDRTLEGLATQIRQGNAEAVALMDTLRAEGVFERHPRLAALADA